MNELIARFGFTRIPQIASYRWLLVLFLASPLLIQGDVGEAAFSAYADAYLGVSVFVFFTLTVLYGLERFFNADLIDRVADRPVLQIVTSAALGMMPGCGGAIVVITGYAKGKLSFGAMVATLTATMGDAAFLLLAKAPGDALVLLPIAFVAGTITGIATDLFYSETSRPARNINIDLPAIGKIRVRDGLTFAFFIPGFVFGILGLAQFELPSSVDNFAVVAMFLSLAVWALSPIQRMTCQEDHPITRATEETAFVIVWVLLAFLLFDVSQAYFQYDLANVFQRAIWITPLLGALIGFIPGCGPHIVVTTAYLSGAVPFGALMANAISNDGDALFPAIAITPQKAVIASIITFIPAMIVGYGFLFLSS